MRRLIVFAACFLSLTEIAAAGNPADALDNLPIDGYHYDYARHCTRSPTPGALALKGWLEKHSSGVFWGIMRCEKLGPHDYSLHADGRAIDWHLDAHTVAGRREARRLITLFLAPDKLGNDHALARRMGIQEIIWNCRAWWAGSGGMAKYSVCYDKQGHPLHVDDTTAHRNHIHIGLNRLGARKLTSFWRSGSEVGGRSSEVGGPRSGVGGRESEVGSRRSEVRGLDASRF